MPGDTAVIDRADAHAHVHGTRARRPQRVSRVPQVGVACAGSLARFFTLFGAFARLEERGVTPAVLSGSSSGALAAVLYARFGALGAIEVAREFCREGNRAWWRLVRPRFPSRRTWLTFRPLAEWMESHTGLRRIEDLARRVSICVTDLETGEPRYLTEGPLGAACAATCSFGPAEPIEIDGRAYVDGGYSVNLPVGACYEAGADVVVALDPTRLSTPAAALRARRPSWRGPFSLRDLPDVAPDHWLPLGAEAFSRFDLCAWGRMIGHGYRASGPLARAVAVDLARRAAATVGQGPTEGQRRASRS